VKIVGGGHPLGWDTTQHLNPKLTCNHQIMDIRSQSTDPLVYMFSQWRWEHTYQPRQRTWTFKICSVHQHTQLHSYNSHSDSFLLQTIVSNSGTL